MARLLLVDDYPDALEAWTLLMRLAGHQVVAAGTGEGAVAAAARLHPDAILLDLQLPGMSGFDVAQILQNDEETAGIPIIAVTGLTRPAEDPAHQWDRFASVVSKPCNPGRLLEEVQRVLAAAPLAVARVQQTRARR